jgi:hypothetical protein
MTSDNELREMLQLIPGSQTLAEKIWTAAESELSRQLEWLEDRGMGAETRKRIVRSYLNGNRALAKVLEGMDVLNVTGMSWQREEQYLEKIRRQLARTTKSLDLSWDWSR